MGSGVATVGDLAILVAGTGDIDDWANLRRDLWPTCSLERHRLEIGQLLASAGVVAIAAIGGKTIGFAEVSIRVDHVEGTSKTPVPYLEGWYVAPAYRGRGVGTALLDFVESWARQRGYREIASDAEIDNAGSIQLHLRRGFTEVARTVHFVKRL